MRAIWCSRCDNGRWVYEAHPNGPDWLHEVKYDGYRLRLERDGDRVRLVTRGGYDWTRRYPRIVEARR